MLENHYVLARHGLDRVMFSPKACSASKAGLATSSPAARLVWEMERLRGVVRIGRGFKSHLRRTEVCRSHAWEHSGPGEGRIPRPAARGGAEVAGRPGAPPRRGA